MRGPASHGETGSVGSGGEDPLLLFERVIIDLDGEHEAIELRLDQQVCAFLLEMPIIAGQPQRRGSMTVVKIPLHPTYPALVIMKNSRCFGAGSIEVCRSPQKT